MKTNIKSLNAALPRLGVGLPDEFLSRLCIEEYLDKLGNEISLNEGVRQRLGGLFHAAEHNLSKQFDEDIVAQRQGNCKRGEILLDNNILTQHEKNIVREFQRCQASVEAISGKFALGNILVANGQITRSQLEDALHRQVATGRRFGDELILSGHASRKQIEGGVSLQRKLVAYALAATVGLAPVARTAEAAQEKVAMPVSVTVIANAKMQTSYQATQLNVSELDVARGYVDIVGASRFSVVSNSRSGYILEFNPVNNLFVSVLVSGLGNDVQLGADGGEIVQRVPMLLSRSHELSFRFALQQDVKPGSYSWPLLLSIRSL